MASRKTNRQAGYNLVEVLIAMALMAVVLLGIMTLFVLGRGNIYSGKQMTHLVSVGTRAMEDISAMNVDDLYANFNIPDGTAIPSTITVNPSSMPESAYTNSILRSTASVTTAGVCGATPTIVFANDPKFYLRNWWCQLQGTQPLPSSSISLVLTPRVPNPTAAAISVGPTGSATVVRARLIIRWSEGLRPRQMILDTTKYNRPLAD
jgi:prepilin-type N-terminal cleavage/methylation domain-containing protein